MFSWILVSRNLAEDQAKTLLGELISCCFEALVQPLCVFLNLSLFLTRCFISSIIFQANGVGQDNKCGLLCLSFQKLSESCSKFLGSQQCLCYNWLSLIMHPTNSLTMLLLMHTCYLEGMAGGRIKRSRAYQTYLHPKRCQRDVTFELTISQGTPTKTCEPGLRYCGHELTRYGNVVLEALYSCSSDGVSMVGLATCAKCKAQGRSYCHCTPYANYCGHQLIDSYYWNNVLRDTSYVCDSSGMSATELKSCAHGCSGDGICIAGTCTSGAYYCGHELVKDDWSTMKYKLLPNERWKCSSDGKSAEYGECGSTVALFRIAIHRVSTPAKEAPINIRKPSNTLRGFVCILKIRWLTHAH